MPNFKILGRLEVPFSFIPPRVPEKKGLDRRTDGRTDGQQSDPIRVPFFPFEVTLQAALRPLTLCAHNESERHASLPGMVSPPGERHKSERHASLPLR
ncbi:hypothetical protein EVAR_58760_1 [Eumeta japonica]|uniref:Uncharacterized protein n=1 Tax=Eumeta variegata TaxID=151549 RepID=A0A4C1ZGI1_EUMVA|nr:hypothetical protein EVAR_58760_1 [Eumeta japonica]